MPQANPRVELIELTNADPDFYPALGPYLANHAVYAALGGTPWDEATKTWIVLRDHEGVIAFCAVNQLKASTWLESLYVDRDTAPHAREDLVAAAVERYGHDRDLRTKIRTENTAAYTAHGFAIVSERGNFTTLVRPATIRKAARR
jgi:hypothetical protein